MRKYARIAILVPLGIVILVFALANRQIVVFSLDPLGAMDPDAALVFAMPLFALAIILVIVGVLIGGIATWIRQAKWRRMARQLDSEARALRADNERLKRETDLRASTPRIAQAAPAGGLAATHSE